MLSSTTDQTGRRPLVWYRFTRSGGDFVHGLIKLLKMQMAHDNQRRLDEQLERTERQRRLDEYREERRQERTRAERDKRRHGKNMQFVILTFGRQTARPVKFYVATDRTSRWRVSPLLAFMSTKIDSDLPIRFRNLNKSTTLNRISRLSPRSS